MNRALIKHFLRSFRNRKSWMALYLSSSVFGIAGLFLLFTLKSGIDGSLQERSQLFLTADLSVSARRLFTDEEKLTLADSLKDFATESTRVLDLLSMIRVGQDRSRLIELVGVEKAYPLYGKIETETNTPVSQVGDAQMVVDSDLRDQLGLQVGSQARVGDLAWKVSGVIKEDTSSVWKGLTFAPTAYVSASYLRQSDLLKKGSTLTERFYYRLKDSDQAESVAKLVRKAIPDSGVRVTSHIQSNEQITRSLDYLSDYLGLLGTVSFLLAFVGTLYLVQTERKRVRFEMAILRSLGLTPGSVLKLLWIESAGLSLLMTLIAWVVVRLISQPLLTWIGGQIGVSIRTETSVLVLGVAFLFSFVTYGLSTLLLLRGELKFPLRSLLSGGNDQDQAARPGLFEIAVAALFVLALSMAVSHSYRLGIAFSIGLWFAAAVIAGVFVLINRILPKQLNERGAFRLIALHLSRNPLSQGIAFGTMSFSALLLFLIPGLSTNFREELQSPEAGSLPSLFLFDIQPEQLPSLEQFFKSTPHTLDSVSPMIRARLEKVNGAPALAISAGGERFKSREEQEEERTRNRGYNLTYRAHLFGSEKIVSGRNVEPKYTAQAGKLPELTVEKRFAERLGLKVGDTLEFDIQSVPVEGRIVGMRSVKWTSFQPNFFVQFQPGVIEDAPKTFLATVHTDVKDSEISRLQSQLIEPFPNVSVISVRTMVAKIVGIFGQMELAVVSSALFVLLAGLLVFFSIIRLQAAERSSEVQLLKVFGGSLAQVRAVVLGEAILLSVLSVFFGALLALIFTEAMVRVLFSRSATIPVGAMFTLGVGAVVVLTVLSSLAMRSSLNAKPNQLLES